MNPRRLATNRLVLVSATSQHLLVERQDPSKLGRLLAADVADRWPDGGYEPADLQRWIEDLSAAPPSLVWRRRYIVLKKTPTERACLVGHLALSGPPKFGTVHMEDLFVVPERLGQGIEREALGIVLDWAMAQDEVQRVVADAPDEHNGAAQLGMGSDLGFVLDEEAGRLVRTREGWLADGPATPRKLVPQPADVAVQGIPTVAREIFERLLQEPLREADDLRRECALYLGLIETAAEKNPYVDNALGRQIAALCDALLADIDASTPEHTRRQIQAATRYFVTEDDGDSDLAIGGLDEDAAVADAVAEHLGRGDLATELA